MCHSNSLADLLHLPTRSSSFFFNDTATTEIYTLSLHDALPIFDDRMYFTAELIDGDDLRAILRKQGVFSPEETARIGARVARSEEHTSELQSRLHLVCRLLLEKKKTNEPIVELASKPPGVRDVR